MEPLFAAVDLGGTKIAVALGDAAGRLSCAETIPTPNADPQSILATIADLIDMLSLRAGRRPVALGAGLPGLIDTRTGHVHFAPMLPAQWRGVSAGPYLQQRLGLPVRLLNDARCAALGELLYGHGREYRSFVLFTLGTGIGGGIVIDGRLRLGPLSAAGELGHQTVIPDGPLCVCGNTGCLETVASGPAIAHAAAQPDAEAAAIAARRGDPRAQHAFRQAAVHLGIAAANLVTSLHPDAVLFAGGMSELVDLLLMPVRAAITERVRLFPADGVAVRRAATGSDAGLLGALALAVAPDRIGM